MRLRGGKQVGSIFSSVPYGRETSATESSSDSDATRREPTIKKNKEIKINLKKNEGASPIPLLGNSLEETKQSSEFTTTSEEEFRYEKKLLKESKDKKKFSMKLLFTLAFFFVIGLVKMFYSALLCVVMTTIFTIVVYPTFILPRKIVKKCLALFKSGDNEEANIRHGMITSMKLRMKLLFTLAFFFVIGLAKIFYSALHCVVMTTIFTIVVYPTFILPQEIIKKCLALFKSGDNEEEANTRHGMMTRRKKLEMDGMMRMRTKGKPKRGMLTYIVHTLNAIVILILLWQKFVSTPEPVVPDPKSLGLNNCNEINLPSTTRIRAWHLAAAYRKDMSITDALNKQGASIVLHLRGKGKIENPGRIKIIKNLALNNHHVLTPLFTLDESQILQTWYHLNAHSKGSHIYTWFDEFDVDTVKKLAHGMCLLGSPPSGIIIQRAPMKGINFQSMETWSQTCGTDDKFKLLKCPIAIEQHDNDIQLDIRNCFRNVRKSTAVEDVWGQLGSFFNFFRKY